MKDYFGYKGKIVVITGASSGMGKATAEMLVDLGAKVYALNRSEVKVEGIEKYIPTDVSNKESIDKAFENIPDHIESFFGIAGASGVHTDFLTTVKTDLISNKYITENILLNRMNEGGSIAYMSSIAGNGWELEDNMKHYLPVLESSGWDEAVEVIEKSLLVNLPGNLGYSFSKRAIHYLVAKYQALFAPKKIRVNAVLPGSTDTGLKDDFVKLTGSEDNLIKYTGYAQRLAKSEEMAKPIVFLNSNMASYISGELMVVDYGTSIEAVAKIKPDSMGFTFDMIIKKM